MDTDQRPRFLYRLFADDGRLLYVGVAVDIERRLNQHHSKSWWRAVATETVVEYPSRLEAEAAEREAIQSEVPLHNISHSTINQPTARSREWGEPIMPKAEVAEHLGIDAESVRSTLRRYGITERRGYLRSEVLALQRRGQGWRRGTTTETSEET